MKTEMVSMMTVEDTKKRIVEIRSKRDDSASAHIMEDELFHDFVRDVSLRRDELGKIARIVLKSGKIKFSRWYS